MRESGILLHVTSLPSNYGIGTFGKASYEFVDFLKETKQTYWQILPIGPTSFGDSPYQSFSSNALNPYFIDLDILVEEGLLKKEDIIDSSKGRGVNYGKLWDERFIVLRKAFNNFNIKDEQYLTFLKEHSDWLLDYAVFKAIKTSFNDVSLIEWPSEIRKRNIKEVNKLIKLHKEEIEFQKFLQFKTYEQYLKLKEYANNNGIKIMGDIPIYVSYDSSDVWMNPNYFQLDDEFKPTFVAGVPPDNFSADGQLWGNPLYNWDELEKTNFKWWINRIKGQARLFDAIRIDHFIGFVNYFSIPASDDTAKNGVWKKAPGSKLFKAIKEELGELNIIAEDLGVVTPEVIELLKETNFPGMKLLQFAFSSDEENTYLPHFYEHNSVAFTGTHDNETTKEWLSNLNKEDLNFCLEYINSSLNDAVNALVKETLKSPSKLAIIPMQDYLELGSDGRMNIPSTLGSNWEYRLRNNYQTKKIIDKITLFTSLYGRARKD